MARATQAWFLSAALVLAGLCLGGGIWLGRQQASRSGSDPRRLELERQLQTLQQQLGDGEADPAAQQRLLELLVALDRKPEATTLLASMADRDPQRWQLRLLLAELHRNQGDRVAASREVRQLLTLQPERIEALQLLSLVLLEQGRTAEAIHQVQAVFARQMQPRPRPEALATGLLLAELLDKQGSPGQAEAVLIRLSTAFAADQRPLLARALLLQQRGNTKAAQVALMQARALKPGSQDQTLDRVASAWGLSALREPSPTPKPPQQASPDSPPQGRASGSRNF